MAEYTVKVRFVGEDKISGTLRGVRRALSSLGRSAEGLGSPLGALGGHFMRVAEIASGVLVARGIEAAIGGFQRLGRAIVDLVGQQQMLELNMEGLIAEQLMFSQTTETFRVAVKKSVEELAKGRAKLDEYLIKQERLRIQLEKLQWQYNEYVKVQGEAGIDARTLANRIAEKRLQLERLNETIARIQKGEVEYATVTRTVVKQVMDFSEASRIAREQVQDLLRWIERTAIISPFGTEQVQLVAKLGLAAGLSAEQVKDFTRAFLDYAAARGIASSNLAFAADQFLQLRKIGKLTAIDLRQLRRLGINVEKVLFAKLGMSVEEFNKKVAQSPELMDKLFSAFVEYAEEVSPGALERFANSIPGILSTAQDAFEVGAKRMFRPLLEAVSPAIGQLVRRLADFVTGPEIERIGEMLGERAGAWMDRVAPVVGSALGRFSSLASRGFRTIARNVRRATDAFGDLRSALRDAGLFSVEFAEALSTVHPALQKVWMRMTDLVNTIRPYVEQVVAFVQRNTEWKDVLIAIGFVVGAVVVPAIALLLAKLAVAGAIFSALVMSVHALRTAWETNAYGIRDVVQRVWGFVSTFIPEAAQRVSAVVSSGLEAVQEFWAAHGDQIMRTASSAWQTVRNAVSEGADFIRRVVSSALAALSSFWSAHGDSIIHTARSLWQTVLDIVEWHLENIRAVFDAFRFAFEGDWYNFGASLRRLVDNLWLGIKTVWSAAFRTLRRVAEYGWQLIRITFRLAIERIRKAFSDVKWDEIGRGIVGGIKEGVKRAAQTLIDTVKGVAQAALDATKGFLGMKSPSRVFMRVGHDMMAGMAQGIREAAALPVNALRTVALRQVAVAQTLTSRAGAVRPDVRVSMGGDTYNISVSDSATAWLVATLVEERRRKRLDEFMGVVP